MLLDAGEAAHFGRGRSAALRTFPVGSMVPNFVPIVSGLATNRSPPLIATHRYPGSEVNRLIAGPISTPVAATLILPWDATRSANPFGSGAALSQVLHPFPTRRSPNLCP